VAARFSGQLGWWNEQLTTDRGFVVALKNMARANILAEEAILKIQPQALFIQSESSEYFHASSPRSKEHADFYNEKRFLSLDLCYGRDVQAGMYEYLMDNGMSREEYHWFRQHGNAIRPHCVMGNDYYITNEHEVFDERGQFRPSGEVFGYYVITKQYFDRYRLPVMHTETNRKVADDAAAWLWKEWSNVQRLKEDGVPILGFTWYSLLDQTDWDTALKEVNHRVNPLGLYDLNRKIRKVGQAYKELIAEWRDHLPLQSMSRDMLLFPADQHPKRSPAGSGNSRAHIRDGEDLEVGSRAKAMREARRRPKSRGRGAKKRS
jgi:beta-glucosidase/6-phospho-beta-glucosidase/beta-galactosidase